MRYLTLFFMLICTNLSASSVSPTKITSILVGPAYPGIAFLTIDPVPSNKAECNTDNMYTYAFDITTETGKATLSAALAASMSNKDVWLGGLSTCTTYSGVEDLAHIVTL